MVSKITSSGEYVDYEKYNARSGKNPISHFWLQLLGIDDDYQIIKNEDFKRQKLTWRTLAPSTLIPQDRVNTSASVLFPGETTQRTAFYHRCYFCYTVQILRTRKKTKQKNIKN